MIFIRYYYFMNPEDFNLQEWLNNPEIMAPILLVPILFVVWINRTRLSAGWQSWRTSRLLNSLGLQQICDLPCPDGLDGEFKLERLVMLPDEIVLVVYKRYPGYIYCAEKISQWTQVLAQKSYKFENPLFELEHQMTALAGLIPDTPIRGYLFFDHSAFFPKGCPDVVLSPSNIPDKFTRRDDTIVEHKITAAWDVLTQMRTEDIPHKQFRVKS